MVLTLFSVEMEEMMKALSNKTTRSRGGAKFFPKM